MAQWIIPPVGVIEPVPAPEFYVEDIGGIELIWPCVRVLYCTRQLPLEAAPGCAQKIVSVKIIRPIDTIPAAISRLVQCLNLERSPDIHSGGNWTPRVVR
jgi:hypothetical protein